MTSPSVGPSFGSGTARRSSSDIAYGFCQCGCGGRTAIARKNDRSRQMIKGEPRRFLPNHHGRVTSRPWRSLSETDYEVVWAGFNSPCHLWRWSRRGRYGKVGLGGRYVAAHRAFYERTHGPIPDGLELDHLCRNTLCVNPEHLEPVTHTENMRRGANTRISDETVDAIRAWEGTLTSAARHFGVSVTHVWEIRRGTARA